MDLDPLQCLLQEVPLGISGDPALPVFLEVHIQPMDKMDAAQNKIVAPLAQPLQKQGLVLFQQAELHAPANFQPRDLQAIVLPAVGVYVEHHGLAHGQGVEIHMVRKADLPQALFLGGGGQGQAGIVAVEGDDGVDVVVKHSYFSSQNSRKAVGRAAEASSSGAVSQAKPGASHSASA